MGDSNTMSAISHLVLAGTSSWALRGFHAESWNSYNYTIYVIHGVVGFVKFLAPGETIDSIYENTTFLSVVWAMPCMATHVALGELRREFALAHIGFSVVPVIMYYSDKDYQSILDTYLAVCCCSMGYWFFTHENWWGVGATVWYVVNYFMLHKEGETLFELPALDCFTYGSALFTFLAERAFAISA